MSFLVENGVLKEYTGSDTVVVITGDEITEIGCGAFSEKCVQFVYILGKVKKICQSAFYGCAALETVVFGDNVTEIGQFAFYGCTALEAVELPDYIMVIDECAFRNCTSLKKLTLPKYLKRIEEQAFAGCAKLKTLVLPDTVTSVGDFAFENCTKLKMVYGGRKLKEIGVAAFENCTSLRKIYNIANRDLKIGARAFRGCRDLAYTDAELALFTKLFGPGRPTDDRDLWGLIYIDQVVYGYWEMCAGIALPYCTRGISSYAFEKHCLDSVKFNHELKFIGEGAFESCPNLKSVFIPASVAEIGNRAFHWCASLETAQFSENIGITEISNNMFEKCAKLKTVNIPDSVIRIGRYAFADCSSLEDITIPDSVTEIDIGAFKGCLRLRNKDGFTIIRDCLYNYYGDEKKIRLPDNIKKISSEAFPTIYGPENIILNNGLREIDNYAFYFCKFKEMRIPDGVTRIGNCAFMHCDKLEEINIPDSVTKLGIAVFSDCTALTRVRLPKGISAIEGSTFENCKSLKEITIPDGVKVYHNAFDGCPNLEKAYIPADVTLLECAFENCPRLTIVTPAGSPAEQYAKENGIPVENF